MRVEDLERELEGIRDDDDSDGSGGDAPSVHYESEDAAQDGLQLRVLTSPDAPTRVRAGSICDVGAEAAALAVQQAQLQRAESVRPREPVTISKRRRSSLFRAGDRAQRKVQQEQTPAQKRWGKIRGMVHTQAALGAIRRDIRAFGVGIEEPAPASSSTATGAGAGAGAAAGGWRTALVINPSHPWRLHWDKVVMFLLLYVAFVIPFRVSFYFNGDSGGDGDAVWFAIEVCADVLFGIDIVINSFTGTVEEGGGKVVMTQPEVFKAYARSWLAIDLIATFPVYAVMPTNSGANRLTRLARVPRLLKVMRLLRFLKLVRLLRMRKYMKRTDLLMRLGAAAKRLLEFSFWVLLMLHLTSCVWFVVAAADEFHPDTWVFRRHCDLDAAAYDRYDAMDDCALFTDDNIGLLYLEGLYFSLSTMTTVGYGDIYAQTALELMVALVAMLLGVSFYAYTISSLSALLTTLDLESNTFRAKLGMLSEFIRKKKLPKPLQQRLLAYFQYSLHQRTVLTPQVQELLFNDMSLDLRTEVVQYVHRHVIEQIPFLLDKDPIFVSRLVVDLKPLTAERGEVVLRQHEHAGEMFFVRSGRLELRYFDQPVSIIVEGSFVGEAAVIQTAYNCTALATVQSDLYAWPRASMIKILADFPAITHELESLAVERVRRMKAATGGAVPSAPNFRKQVELAQSKFQRASRKTSSAAVAGADSSEVPAGLGVSGVVGGSSAVVARMDALAAQMDKIMEKLGIQAD